MYGTAVYPPAGAIILRQHWFYSIKSDGTRKARNCCDGSPRAAPALKLANTYSSCIEQPCMRMFFALCAHEGYFCIKVDTTNAYANSPPPDQPTYVFVDQPYADWFLVRYGFDAPPPRPRAPCATRLAGTPRIWCPMGTLHQQSVAPPRFQVHHARAQLVQRNLRWMEDAHLPTS